MALKIVGKKPEPTKEQAVETMVAAQEITNAQADVMLSEHPSVGYCAECKNPQYATPSGPVCNDGHGGADTLTAEEAGKTPVDPVQAAVANAEATGADPYLAGITAKADLKLPADTPADLTPSQHASGPLTPGQAGYQEQVAKAFNMEVKEVNGIKVLSAKTPVAEEAPSTSPFAADAPAPAPVPASAPAAPALSLVTTVKEDRRAEGSVLDAIQAAEANPYSIMTALEDLKTGKKIGTLMFVHRESGLSYTVLGHNDKTGVTTMKNSTGIILHPILGQREAAIYYPQWR